ncbi:hypothetical protein EIY87_36215 [Amycolatopsis eburnea]|uniref:YihY/virulence factor BrkB family protein n=1 Tax=Amycolatopsis eburnea TaxID=2267691 RepID=A0A3R9F3U8_9PSEU|nr:hypothetical protein EIY87_36215 [Amycolatopsis eburnea]
MVPGTRWTARLVRAARSFSEHDGTAYAAAITYFTVLSVVPVAMVACAAAGVVLAGDHELAREVHALILAQLPPAWHERAAGLVDDVVDARAAFGLAGLATGLYSGIG